MVRMPDTATVGEARQRLREDCFKGTNCDVCRQRVQMYKYTINGTAVADLINLYNLTGGKTKDFRHVNEFSNLASRSFTKLKHWGLIEDSVNEDTAKRTSGMWAMTDKGRAFVLGQIMIPDRVILFNKQAYNPQEKNEITVEEALGKKFNYQELISGK